MAPPCKREDGHHDEAHDHEDGGAARMPLNIVASFGDAAVARARGSGLLLGSGLDVHGDGALDSLGNAVVGAFWLQRSSDDIGGLGAVGVVCQDLVVHIVSVPSTTSPCHSAPVNKVVRHVVSFVR